MTPTPDTELMAVTQADRVAAAAYMDRVKSTRWSIGGILIGGCDNTSVVQAFARHRIASTRPADSALGDGLAIRLAHHVIIGLLDMEDGGNIVGQLSPAFFDQAAAALRQPAPPPDSALGDDLTKLAVYADHAGLGRADRDVIAAIYSRMSVALRQPAPRADDALRSRYHELLYEVSHKFPGETRHETALRYIRDREARQSESGSAALASEKPADAAKGD